METSTTDSERCTLEVCIPAGPDKIKFLNKMRQRSVTLVSFERERAASPSQYPVPDVHSEQHICALFLLTTGTACTQDCSASRVLFAGFVRSKCITVLRAGCSIPVVNIRPSDRRQVVEV